MVTLPEEAKKTSGDALGIVGDNLRGIEADIAEAVKDLEKTSREVEQSRRVSRDTLGGSPEISSQVSQLSEARLKNEERLLDAKVKQKALEADLLGLQKAKAKLVGERISREDTYLSTLKVQRKIEEDYAAAKERVRAAEARLAGEGVGGSRNINTFSVSLQKSKDELEAANKGLDEIKKKIDSVRSVTAVASNARKSVEKDQKTADGLIRVTQEAIAKSKQFQREETEKALALEIRKLAILAEAGNFEKQIALDRKDSDLQADTESLQALLAGDEKALAVAKARAAVREADIDQQALSRRYLADIANAQRLIARAEASRDPTVRDGVKLLREQKQLITDTYDVERKIAEAKRLAVAEEERLARLRQNGTASEGVAEGIKQLQAARKSTATIMQDLVVSFADGLASALAQSVTTAISTGLRGGDVGAAITQIGEQLALSVLGGLLTDLFKNSISSLLGAATAAPAAAAAATTAAGIQRAAAVTAGKTVIADAGAAGGSFASFVTSATTTMVTAVGVAVAKAATVLGVSTAAGGAGGAAVKAHGGKILPFGIPDTNRTGFARGGSTTRKSRPLGRDPRDTVPAMLRPGEWVIRPEAVGKYGDRFMSLLNRGKINPALLRGLTGGSSPAPTPKRSFATGGPVLAAAASAPATTQNVLLFHDEQTMDRSLAAGPDSMLRFARTHRASYRAALGV